MSSRSRTQRYPSNSRLLQTFSAHALTWVGTLSWAAEFQNGDFESHTLPHNPGSQPGYYYAAMTVGDTAVSGWSWIPGVQAGPAVGEYIRGYFQDASPFRGGFVELGSYYSHIGIAQTFSTHPLSAYSVSFQLASNPLNSEQGPGRLQVSAGQASGEFDAAPASGNQENLGWQWKAFNFTSDASGETTLSFKNLQGIVELDSIRVRLIPEPGVAGLLLTGMVGIVAFHLRSKGPHFRGAPRKQSPITRCG